MNSHLLKLGWSGYFQQSYDLLDHSSWTPVRVVRENRGRYIVSSGEYEAVAQLSGAYRIQSPDWRQIPTVGDWVCIDYRPSESVQIIHSLIPRKTLIERQVAGAESKSQLIAANIDTLFLMSGLDADLNFNRIQRYLTMAGNSGAQPVIVLNKSDLCRDLRKVFQAVESVAPNVPIHSISAIAERGLECIRPFVLTGQTVALLGSSGVGKSTLVNALLGEAKLLTQSNRHTGGRGRHTTTWRELIPLPCGGMLVDLPGMRELQLTGEEEGLKRAFEDIESIARQCRFRDCRHEGEPDCAIEAAMESGVIDPSRYTQFLKLKHETALAKSRSTERARQAKSPKRTRQEKDRYFKEAHIRIRKNKYAEEKWKRQNDLF